MPSITYIQPDGGRDELQIAEGFSVMQGALSNGVEGMVAECGGNAMCATCHVYVNEDQIGLLKPISEEEDALLDGTAAERKPSSRLSCQIQVTPDLDGLVVHLPDQQI